MAPGAITDQGGITTRQLSPLAALSRGVIIYMLANFGTRALNFLLLPLYTRFLTPSDYGIISLSEIIATVVITVAGLGFDGALTRLYFAYAEDSEEQRQYVGSVVRFGLCTAGLGVTLCFATAILSGQADTWLAVRFYPYIALALTTALVLQATQYTLTLCQVQRRARSYATLTIATFGATAAFCIWLVVFSRRGAEGMLSGKLGGASLAALVAAAGFWPWLRARWSWRFIRETWPLAWPLMPHQLMALGLVIADRFLLEHYRNLAEVGIYSLAYTCGMAMFLMTSSLLQAWSPMFFDLARQGEATQPQLGELTSRLALGLTALATLGVLLAPVFVKLLDPRYAALTRLIPLVIAGYLLHGLFALLQLPILQSQRSRPILYSSSLALAVNLMLNLLWIPRWGMFGAAYATIGGYALEASLIFSFAQRMYPLRYRHVTISGMLIIFAAATAFSELVPRPQSFWETAAVFACVALTMWRVVGKSLTALVTNFSRIANR